jgi:ATP-dependent Clp protease ATP-binding subunit ClpA
VRNGDRLVEISTAAARAADPSYSLRAAAEMRRVIAELEVDAVRRALAQGHSWTEIAAALGITKQAAHKRYAKRTATGCGSARPPAQNGRGRRTAAGRPCATAAVRRAIRVAQVAAVALGSERVQGAHLILGLLAVRGAASQALVEIGAGFRNALEVVRSLRLPSVPLNLRRLSAATSGEIPLAGAVEKAINQSFREAVRLGHDQVEGEHVLLGLLRRQEPTAIATLSGIGISSRDLERCLGKILMRWDLSAVKRQMELRV